MNNEPNKPVELTDKELEGISGGVDEVGNSVYLRVDTSSPEEFAETQVETQVPIRAGVVN